MKLENKQSTVSSNKGYKSPTLGLIKIKNNSAVKTAVKQSLNLDFFFTADGVYNSYWVGKLANTLLSAGKKKVVLKHLYKAFIRLKYYTNSSPIMLLLEVLEKIKPLFRLRNYVVRRTIIKEYPIVTLRSRQHMLAVHWLRCEIQNSPEHLGDKSLTSRVVIVLSNFQQNPKKNNLIKKRAEYTKRLIAAQFNIRYTWK